MTWVSNIKCDHCAKEVSHANMGFRPDPSNPDFRPIADWLEVTVRNLCPEGPDARLVTGVPRHYCSGACTIEALTKRFVVAAMSLAAEKETQARLTDEAKMCTCGHIKRHHAFLKCFHMGREVDRCPCPAFMKAAALPEVRSNTPASQLMKCTCGHIALVHRPGVGPDWKDLVGCDKCGCPVFILGHHPDENKFNSACTNCPHPFAFHNAAKNCESSFNGRTCDCVGFEVVPNCKCGHRHDEHSLIPGFRCRRTDHFGEQCECKEYQPQPALKPLDMVEDRTVCRTCKGRKTEEGGEADEIVACTACGGDGYE